MRKSGPILLLLLLLLGGAGWLFSRAARAARAEKEILALPILPDVPFVESDWFVEIGDHEEGASILSVVGRPDAAADLVRTLPAAARTNATPEWIVRTGSPVQERIFELLARDPIVRSGREDAHWRSRFAMSVARPDAAPGDRLRHWSFAEKDSVLDLARRLSGLLEAEAARDDVSFREEHERYRLGFYVVAEDGPDDVWYKRPVRWFAEASGCDLPDGIWEWLDADPSVETDPWSPIHGLRLRILDGLSARRSGHFHSDYDIPANDPLGRDILALLEKRRLWDVRSSDIDSARAGLVIAGSDDTRDWYLYRDLPARPVRAFLSDLLPLLQSAPQPPPAPIVSTLHPTPSTPSTFSTSSTVSTPSTPSTP